MKLCGLIPLLGSLLISAPQGVTATHEIPAAQITITVGMPDSKPVPGVTIQVISALDWDASERVTPILAEGVTGPEGSANLSVPALADLRVTAFDSRGRFAQATLGVLQPDEHMSSSLTLNPRVELRVKAQTDTGEKVTAGWIQLTQLVIRDFDDNKTEWRSPDEEGRLVFRGLAPGVYRAALDLGGERIVSSALFEVNDTVEEQVLSFEVDAVEQIRVVDPSGKPIEGLWVEWEILSGSRTNEAGLIYVPEAFFGGDFTVLSSGLRVTSSWKPKTSFRELCVETPLAWAWLELGRVANRVVPISLGSGQVKWAMSPLLLPTDLENVQSSAVDQFGATQSISIKLTEFEDEVIVEVVDLEGQPVPAALVECQGLRQKTDSEGRVRIRAVKRFRKTVYAWQGNRGASDRLRSPTRLTLRESTEVRVNASLDDEPYPVGMIVDWFVRPDVAPAKWRASGDRFVARNRVWFKDDYGSLLGEYLLFLIDSNQRSRKTIQLPEDRDQVVQPQQASARLLKCGLLIQGLNTELVEKVTCESAEEVKFEPPEFFAKTGVVRQIEFLEGCHTTISVTTASGRQSWSGVPEPGGIVEIHLE